MSYPSKRRSQISLPTVYGFWALGFFGLCGMHRFYLGKPCSGILYLFTFGLLFMGQLIDVLLIPAMVKERNLLLWAASMTDSPMELAEIGRQTLEAQARTRANLEIENKNRSQTTPMQALLNAAAENDGVLSLAQAVRATGFEPKQAKELLDEAIRHDLAVIGNDPETGSIRYFFDL
jgi:TM2 domain-containing membrane protein YozV